MRDDAPSNYLDEVAEELAAIGGLNVRQEAARLRGAYLSRWMDLEFNLDELIAEYLEVPESKRSAMIEGFLPLVASARAKVEFVNISVKRVDPDSDAYRLARKAQETRNALAHRAAPLAHIPSAGEAASIPFYIYRHGEQQRTHIVADEALALVDAANEAIFQLTLKARPDYTERQHQRTLDMVENMGKKRPNV